MFVNFYKAIGSPRLFWVHKLETSVENGARPVLALGHAYVPNGPESWGQFVVSWVRFIAEFSLYTSPLLVFFFARPLGDLRQHGRTFGNLFTGAAILYISGIILRSYGRITNPVYVEFLHTWRRAIRNFSTENKEALMRYDFEFWGWPVEFKADLSKSSSRTFIDPPTFAVGQTPYRLIGWLMMHSFGLKLIYPGSMKWMMQTLLGPFLCENRAQHVVKRRGQRAKLKSSDGNEIDVMFFDRRGKSPNGNSIVVVCEGNAGFYEMGMLNTPYDAGFSIIGWNHPGFWGSSGSPFPDQDAHAADVVMQYVRDKLKFPEESVIVYGWSIGGYPATWIAMNYPNIQGLILDATFDHLVPLAVPRMPKFLEKVVEVSVRDNVNLNIAAQLIKFKGPVRIIRRTRDEMISTDERNVIGSNRGNFLFIYFLSHRYPNLITSSSLEQLSLFLSFDLVRQVEMLSSHSMSNENLFGLLSSYMEEHGTDYPMSIGDGLADRVKAELLIYLAHKYRTEFDSGHNNPLPSDLFQLPWDSKTP